jgi:hypothetical protein
MSEIVGLRELDKNRVLLLAIIYGFLIWEVIPYIPFWVSNIFRGVALLLWLLILPPALILAMSERKQAAAQSDQPGGSDQQRMAEFLILVCASVLSAAIYFAAGSITQILHEELNRGLWNILTILTSFAMLFFPYAVWEYYLRGHNNDNHKGSKPDIEKVR